MRFSIFAFAVMLAACFSHGRSLASIRKDAFTVGVGKSDSAAEYNFISEMTKKMKMPRFRLVAFESASAGQKLLLDGKIDAIISRVSYSAGLEGKFLVSVPYGKAEIAVATLAGSKVWTLADLDGKALAFIPRDVPGERLRDIWRNSRLNATQSLEDACNSLRSGEVEAVVASRQSLEAQGDSLLRIFPNRLHENSMVALFAPGSEGLREEFNRHAAEAGAPRKANGGGPGEDPAPGKERLARIAALLSELKKEVESMQKEMK